MIKQIQVGSIGNFNYLIGDPETGVGALVDPAWEPERLLALAKDNGVAITDILITHCHHDHVDANGAIKDATGATIRIHEAEMPYRKHFFPPAGDVAMADGEQIKIGNITVTWLHTPGHSPGSSCLLVDDVAVITADTLFVNSIGRTDFPGSEPEEMFASIQKLKTLPDHLIVYPGHNYGPTPTTTIGDQKRVNPFWQPETLNAFMALAQPDNDI